MPQYYHGLATSAVEGGVGCGAVALALMFFVGFCGAVLKAVSAEAAERILWAALAIISGAILLILTAVIVVDAVRSARRPSAPPPAVEEAEE